MPMILTECPWTGNLVSTGVSAESWDEIAPSKILSGCPDCGGDHPWTADDTAFANSDPHHLMPQPG